MPIEAYPSDLKTNVNPKATMFIFYVRSVYKHCQKLAIVFTQQLPAVKIASKCERCNRAED